MDKTTNFLSLILLDALEDENESDIDFILERNCELINPSYVPQGRGIAPLHYVCGMQNYRLAKDVTARLLEMGANPNCRSEDNMTPLHVAAIYGRGEIVRLLLQYGAELEIYDNDRKTPLLYAIEECSFEVVRAIRDHIFLKKYKKNRQDNAMILNAYKHENNSLNNKQNYLSTPQKASNENPTNQSDMAKHKNVLQVHNALDDSMGDSSGNDSNKFTPNRIHYNYDVTSPYYINITHRRHKPQPKYPNSSPTALSPLPPLPPLPTLPPHPPPIPPLPPNISFKKTTSLEDISISMQNANISSPEPQEDTVNIFTLTEENLKELTRHHTTASEKSRMSLIEIWRNKVKKSRASQSVLREFKDIAEMIDELLYNDQLNFTNAILKDKSPQPQAEIDIDGDAIGPTSCCPNDAKENIGLREKTKTSFQMDSKEIKTLEKPQMSLGKLMQTVTEAKKQDLQPDGLQSPSPQQAVTLESSYQTVPEIVSPKEKIYNATRNFICSPKNNEYILQMTEAYVHTDDENGLVFYENKLLSNVGNQQSQQRNVCLSKKSAQELNRTMTSQSTNLTLPLDYETDALRAELTAFGEPPGPITKSTKRLYIRRLIKFKHKTEIVKELQGKCKQNEFKFSVELQRTLKSEEMFQRIKDYMIYEQKSMEYFDSSNKKKQMREGHLKQSFIYMLIDPRISCNLPGGSVFLNEFEVWHRFLKSIFYVGKGKTSRPYSHLYDAMKIHSRMHNKELQEKTNEQGEKKISFKRLPLNAEIFKSPPQKSLDSKKLDRILNIWGNGYGVVCLHVFHNIIPIEAYTREAAIIEALSLQHLTNCKRGDYYGPVKTWTMKEKKYLGIALLFKAMRIYLAEGESQLSPSDLI